MGDWRLVARPAIPEGLHPAVALEQAGVFTRSQARGAGWSDDVARRLLRQGLWVPVAGGVLRERSLEVGPWQRAWAVALSGRLVVSHCTAARLWGLPAPEHLHGTSDTVVLAPDLDLHRGRFDRAELREVDGLTLTDPVRTLSDMLRHLPLEPALEVVTAGFQSGILRARDLEAAALTARRRWGVDRVREIAGTCSREPHSVLEWKFHRIADHAASGWLFNVDIADQRGRFIARVDALHPASRSIVELDGRAHHGEDRFQPDRTRDQRLAAEGYVVLRLTWSDVTQREAEMVELIRRTVAARMGSAAPVTSRPLGQIAGHVGFADQGSQ